MEPVSDPPIVRQPLIQGSNQMMKKDDPDRIERRNELFFPVAQEKLSEVYGISKKRRFEIKYLSAVENCITVMPDEKTKKIVNICSNTYKLTTLEEILVPIEEAIAGLDWSVRYMHSEHCRFFIDYVFDKYVEISEGDVIMPKIRIQHSYSGDVKFEVVFGFWRQVCSNGLMLPISEKTMRLKFKHTTGKSAKEFDRMHSAILSFTEQFDDYAGIYRDIANSPVEDAEARMLEVCENTKYPKKLVPAAVQKALEECQLLGVPMNDWILYNAMQAQLEHDWDTLEMQPWNRVLVDKELIAYIGKTVAKI